MEGLTEGETGGPSQDSPEGHGSFDTGPGPSALPAGPSQPAATTGEGRTPEPGEGVRLCDVTPRSSRFLPALDQSPTGLGERTANSPRSGVTLTRHWLEEMPILSLFLVYGVGLRRRRRELSLDWVGRPRLY